MYKCTMLTKGPEIIGLASPSGAGHERRAFIFTPSRLQRLLPIIYCYTTKFTNRLLLYLCVTAAVE